MASATSDTIREVTEQGIDAVEHKVLDGLDKSREAAQKAAEHGAELHDQAEQAVKDISSQITDYVKEKPLQAAGIAFAAGVVTTLLLSRR